MKNLLNSGNHREKYKNKLEELNCKWSCKDCFWFSENKCHFLKQKTFESEVICKYFFLKD